MTRLPNLELLVYKAIEYLENNKEIIKEVRKVKSNGINFLDFKIETFPQLWGSTSTGFDTAEDGKVTFGCSAMTIEYTTVVHEERTETFVIFFGDKVCYSVQNPTKEFYEDLKDRNMASLSESKKRY